VLLARLVDRLSERNQFVTFEEMERAAARPSSRLASDGVAALVDAAVADSLLLKDLRTFYDRQTGAFTDRWVYRVNVRHPLVASLLFDDGSVD
jgi:hypothetical protein